MSRAAFFIVVLAGFAARADEELHESDYAIKLGATFFETSQEANAQSLDGGYAEAAQVWTKMIAAEEPGVPTAYRKELFGPAKQAAAELEHRAEWNAAGDAPALRALFRSLVHGADLVEHVEVGDRRVPALVNRLLTYDADTAQVLKAPFQVQVDAKDFTEQERKTLLDEVMQGLRKSGLKAETKPPVKEERRVLTLVAKRGKTTAPPADAHHPKVKLPKTAKSCGIEITGVLTQNDKPLLKTDLGARSTFGTEEQCKVGPVRIAAEAAAFRLIEAAMPK